MRKSTKVKQLQGTYRKDREVKANTLEALKELPQPKKIFKLDKNAKRWYRFIGAGLVQTQRFTELDVPNLVLLANAWSQWEWANSAITEKNSEVPGAGYIQEYQTGATGSTPEYRIRSDAEESIIRISKLFGMNFKDRAAIASFFDDAASQLDLFEGLLTHPKDYGLKIVGDDTD